MGYAGQPVNGQIAAGLGDLTASRNDVFQQIAAPAVGARVEAIGP
jgi:hypothetical protein